VCRVFVHAKVCVVCFACEGVCRVFVHAKVCFVCEGV
jgi:hypothetical protein